MVARTPWGGRGRWLVAMQVLIATLAAPAQAQSIDIDPPVIELERVETGVRGEAQVFSATVTDNVGVTETVLHYRTDPEDSYRSVDMAPIGATDIRTASVAADETDVPLIEYYLEARDEGGNRTIRGFAFDPLVRRLEPAGGPPAQAPVPAPEPVPEPGMSTTRKILYGALGVLVVGALIASAGGDDDGSSSEPNPTDIPVTVTVEPLSTQ